MNELLDRLFSTEEGKEIYSNALSAISDFNMKEQISQGVLIGISGGADSVMLLLVLLKYRSELDFNIKAVHVNHSIRGEEAERDESFSRELCYGLGVDFEAVKINVPEIARERHLGVEEAARNERYRIFDSLTRTDESVSTVAVAHNATDNLETVIFNIMRGAGTLGAAGIKPVRDNIIRPLIYSSKALILSALENAGVEFVTDSTNAISDYSRNYIRNEILPHLYRISDSPEAMATRFSQNMRADSDFINSIAEKFALENCLNGKIDLHSIRTLEKPVFSRVLMIMCKNSGLPSPEKIHIDSVFNLCRGGDFSFSLPGGMSFVSSEGSVYIGVENSPKPDFMFFLEEGLNRFPNFESVIVISKDKNVDCYSNIYKIAIQDKIKSDIINSGLYVRSKKDGDAYRFGGMTRKLKKLFCDKKIPVSKRNDIPLICDSDGILWVPGLRARDGGGKGEEWFITILEPHITEEGKRYFFQFPKN